MGALIPVAGAIILVELDQDCVRMVKVPEVGFGGRSFRSAFHGVQSLQTILATSQAVRQRMTSGGSKVSSGWSQAMKQFMGCQRHRANLMVSMRQ